MVSTASGIENAYAVRLDSVKIGDIVLRPGDTLLLESRPAFLDQQRNSRDFFLVSRIGDSHPLNHERAMLAILITAAMVLSVAFGWLSMLKAGLLAAGLMIITRCTDGRIARQAPDWQVLIVIATSFGIGAALQNSGAASFIADGLIGMVGRDPRFALAGVFVTAALLTSFATNNVAAVLMLRRFNRTSHRFIDEMTA